MGPAGVPPLRFSCQRRSPTFFPSTMRAPRPSHAPSAHHHARMAIEVSDQRHAPGPRAHRAGHAPRAGHPGAGVGKDVGMEQGDGAISAQCMGLGRGLG